jgi:hypothetical protein
MQDQLSPAQRPTAIAVQAQPKRAIAPNAFLLILLLLLCALAARHAQIEIPRLLVANDYYAAIDLRGFHRQVVSWFSGEDTYARNINAIYPPGTYPLMWPLYVLPNSINRGIWFSHALVALGILVWICVHESGADSLLENSAWRCFPWRCTAPASPWATAN